MSGVIADRLDNRKTVIVTQSVQMMLGALLAIDVLTGHATAWHVYVIAALTGTALVLDTPARQSMTFQMVGRDELPNAVALNSTLFNVGRVVGPALGGIVIAAVGVGWCFAGNAVSFLAVLTSLLMMRPSEMFPLARRARPTMLRGIREGLSYARQSRTVLVILGMMVVFASLCFNFAILLPVLAKAERSTRGRARSATSPQRSTSGRSAARCGPRRSLVRREDDVHRRHRLCAVRGGDRAGAFDADDAELLFVCGSSSRRIPRTRTRGSSSTRRTISAGRVLLLLRVERRRRSAR